MSVNRILLVAGSANFSTRDVWDGYRLAFEERGITVIPYPTFSFLKVLSTDTVCSDILGTAVDVKNEIDAVVFVDGLYFRGERSRIPLSIRRAGIPTILIATDDPYETIPNSEALYTHRFTNEINCAVDGAVYLPTATNPLPQLPPDPNPEYDLCFVGTIFKDRCDLLVALARFCEQKRRRFVIAGKFTEGTDAFRGFSFTRLISGTIDTPVKLELYARSRVVINEFRKSDAPADSPSPRIFEVTALGQAALLTGPIRKEVRRIYGKHVYHFHDEQSAIAAFNNALKDESQRQANVAAAREITEQEHLYRHRADFLLDAVQKSESESGPASAGEDRLAWIIGCGRTGSTWLAEMLADLPRLRKWHEPYFGRFLKHLEDRPDDENRPSSFFAKRHRHVWVEGLRELFFRMVADRYPQFGRHALVVKEVNTPEIYPWIGRLFPAARVIHLVRDPFDTLDSYLALQKPGSWNSRFADGPDPLSEGNVRRSAKHIHDVTSVALNAFDMIPKSQRLRVRYEDLLDDTAAQITACAALVGTTVSDEEASQAAAKHSFQNYENTGELEFRRKGQAGVWQTSPNFTDEVRQIAEAILGPLRSRLGYAGAQVSTDP